MDEDWKTIMLKCNHTIPCNWRGQGRCTLFDSEYLDSWKHYGDMCPIGQSFEKHIIDLGIPDPHPDAGPESTLYATMWKRRIK